MSLVRADAEALDAADPLAGFRERFAFDRVDVLYVDGNSLGRMPMATPGAVADTLDLWAQRMVSGWEAWIDLPARLGDRLGPPLLGAREGETLVCDSVTVNLFKLAGAALRDREGPVVAWKDDFPTDRYVVEGLGREVVWLDEGDPLPARAALVVRSHVLYRTGALVDLRALAAAAHDAGALLLADLSHSVGSVRIDLRADGVDLATGCTYKYLSAGPGAPAFLWVREELQDGLTSPIQGWFGQRDQFAMGQGYVPREGIERFLAGTPPVLALSAIAPGVDLLAEAGMDVVEQKGRALTSLAIVLHDQWLSEWGFELGTPRAATQRGAHVALDHPDGWQVCRALIERAGVLPDFRPPHTVRFGFPALQTRFVDVFDALDRLRALMADGGWREVDDAPRRVT